MAKKDLTGDMKSGLDGLLSSTKRTVSEKPQAAPVAKKEPAVHCNFVIDKSIHTRMKYLAIDKKYVPQRHCERGYEGVSGEAWEMTRLIPPVSHFYVRGVATAISCYIRRCAYRHCTLGRLIFSTHYKLKSKRKYVLCMVYNK